MHDTIIFEFHKRVTEGLHLREIESIIWTNLKRWPWHRLGRPSSRQAVDYSAVGVWLDEEESRVASSVPA